MAIHRIPIIGELPSRQFLQSASIRSRSTPEHAATESRRQLGSGPSRPPPLGKSGCKRIQS
jgi:hypothetical protein